MLMESKSVVVPANIARDVDEIVSEIRAAAEQQGHSADGPQGKGMFPGVAETLIFVVGGGATWFCKEWIDTFVWPKIADRIKKPSDQAVDFVLSRVPMGAETKQQHNGKQS
jgi:hypothetical protein